jgi:tetratricopeptide (TPR) repeat protein
MATAAALPDGDLQLMVVGDRVFELGDTDAALGIARRLESDPSGSRYAKYLLGRIAAKRGDWPTAIPALEAALPALGKRSDLVFKARVALAGAYASAGDPQRAEESLSVASAIRPQNAAVDMARADALVQLGRVPEALEIYRARARSLPAARTALALVKFREIVALPEEVRNWAEFDALLGPPEELDSALESAYAQSLLWQNQPKAAVEFLSGVVARHPDRTGAWIALAELAAPTDLDAAWAMFDAAEKAAGDGTNLRLARARLLALAGAGVGSILKWAEPAENATPTEAAQLERGIATVLAARGHPAEALALLQKAAARQPYDLEGRYALFEYALRSGATPVAEAAYVEIQKLDGESGPVATAAGFARELSRSGWMTPQQLAVWKPRLESALQRRANWGRLQALAGDAASLENRHADALRHYL